MKAAEILLPSLSVRGQHDAGTRISAAGYPRAVHSKQHQHHDESHNNDALNIDAQSFLILRLVISNLLLVANLKYKVIEV